MPKRQLPIKQFSGGLVTATGGADIQPNQYVYGLDIDPTYPGGLRGRQKDTTWKTGAGTPGKLAIRAELDNNYQALIAGSSIYLYQDGDASANAGQTLNGNVGSVVAMQAQNKAIHIGIGSDQNTPAKWLGLITHKQFGQDPPASPTLADAAITIPQTVQGYSFGLGWKGCIDNAGGYVFTDKAGKRLTRFIGTDPYFNKTSDDIFDNITAMCDDPEVPGDILVFDNGTSTIYRVIASTMTIKSKTELSNKISSDAYIVTDMGTTATDLFIAVTSVAGDVQTVESRKPIERTLDVNSFNTLPSAFLYRVSKGNLSGTVTVTDISPDFTFRVDDLYAYNETTSNHIKLGNLDNYSISIKLGTKCLFRVANDKIGLYGSIVLSGNYGTDTISGSLRIKVNDISVPDYYAISGGGSFVYVTNNAGQPFSRNTLYHLGGANGFLPNTVQWLSYVGTTLHRGYYNTDGQNYYGSSTATLNGVTNNNAYTFSDSSIATTLVKNAAMVYTGSKYFLLNGDGTLEPSARFADSTGAGLASSIGTLSVVEENNGFTEEDITYYYKFSLLYDGYQESPLTTTETVISPNAGKKLIVTVYVPSSVNRRVSHVNIYRAQSGGINGLAKSYYQLVDAISLADAKTETTTSFGNTSVTGRKYTLEDNYTLNQLGPTYESNAGLDETITTSTVNYALSCQQGGYHFVADCWHPVLSLAAATTTKQTIFRSAQGQFNTFNYVNSFLQLPETPVALAAHKSRVFAFAKSRMWRINTDGFYIEDEMNGFGALGPNSVVTTDFGMFFAGPNGIYYSDGGAPQDISASISKSLSGESFSGINPAWLNRDTTKEVSLNYDPRSRSIIVAYYPQGASNYYALVYSIAMQRWDLWNLSDLGTVSAPSVTNNGIPTFWGSNSTSVYTVATNTSNDPDKPFTYISPWFDFDEPGVEKWFYGVKITAYEKAPTSVVVAIDSETPVTLTNPTLEDGVQLPAAGQFGIYRYDIPKVGNEYSKGKQIRVTITAPGLARIDGYSIIFREKIVKGAR